MIHLPSRRGGRVQTICTCLQLHRNYIMEKETRGNNSDQNNQSDKMIINAVELNLDNAADALKDLTAPLSHRSFLLYLKPKQSKRPTFSKRPCKSKYHHESQGFAVCSDFPDKRKSTIENHTHES